MPLSFGARLGPYEVTALIGQGGMGEVYRARDTKLDRDVALKVLPEHFAQDAERLARFQREAKVLASLNHPHIAAIYGLEEAAGVQPPSQGFGGPGRSSTSVVRALVLELVEGPTLADRIAQGRLPIDEALPLARQIAEALEAAHELGIIHRDLKPANVKVRPDGTVKVLDFGLAKAVETRPLSPDVTQSPTITSPAMTMRGVILGTAAYMSPEQAKGREADKRSDIWAFGCVLYEMLTGRRAFEGNDVSDTLAGILRGEPDWSALPASIPAAIRKLLRRCLDKDPRERLPDIGAARLEIKDALTAPLAEDAVPVRVPRRRVWQSPIAAVITASMLVAAGGLATWAWMRPPPASPIRLTIAPPAGEAPGATIGGNDLAISPDGSRVVFVGNGNPPLLYVRTLDQLQPRQLEGLGVPLGPFMSPDGNWVGFFDGLTLKKVTVNGGPALTVGKLPTAGVGGASWGPDNTIVFGAGIVGTGGFGLFRVPAGGGEPEPLTKPDPEKGEQAHRWPELLPGGQAVLFTIFSTTGGIANAQIAVLDLRTGEQKILVTGGSSPHYVPTGHIVYAVAGTLRAVAFDLGRLEVRSDPVPVLERVVTKPNGAASFAAARDGSLAYLAGDQPGGAERTIVWVDRQGREEAINVPPRQYTYPRISPDGARVALETRDQDSDIWVWDLARATLTRLTFDPGLDRLPLWTPDGRRIAFSSQRAASSGVPSVSWHTADGTGAVERLIESKSIQVFPTSFSPDGRRLLFWEESSGTGDDIGVLTMEGQRLAAPLIQTPFNEQNAEVSPDGRWVAYQSDESGQYEVYVRPFPDVDQGRWQVSTGGGTRPAWARSGRELFYLVGSGRIMAVAIQPGQAFAAGSPQVLFEGAYVAANTGRTFDVSPDGKRFLMIKDRGTSQTSAASEIVFIQNWTEELKRLVPTR